MTNHESKLRAALAVTALLLALFQCWYVYLPDTEAVQFHHCRLNAQLDCYKSLSLHGAAMTPFGVPTFPALAGIYCWMAMLLCFSLSAGNERRAAWGAWAAVLAFPATGLSVYVMLDDVLVSKVTSLSTVLILGLGLALCTIGIVRGIAPSRLVRVAPSALGFGALAMLVSVLILGAGTRRLDAREIAVERASKPAQLAWSRFAHILARVGAAHLGAETAPREVLLVVDPADEASRSLMRAAAKIGPTLGGQIAIYFYAPTDARLLEAFTAGRLREFLANPDSFAQRSTDGTDLPPGFARQRDALKRLGVDRYPTALYSPELKPAGGTEVRGRQAGKVDLPGIISALAATPAR